MVSLELQNIREQFQGLPELESKIQHTQADIEATLEKDISEAQTKKRPAPDPKPNPDFKTKKLGRPLQLGGVKEFNQGSDRRNVDRTTTSPSISKRTWKRRPRSRPQEKILTHNCLARKRKKTCCIHIHTLTTQHFKLYPSKMYLLCGTLHCELIGHSPY